MLRYIGDRPVNLSLLMSAFKAYKAADIRGYITSRLHHEDETPDFNKMSDAEIEAAMQPVNRHVNGRR